MDAAFNAIRSDPTSRCPSNRALPRFAPRIGKRRRRSRTVGVFVPACHPVAISLPCGVSARSEERSRSETRWHRPLREEEATNESRPANEPCHASSERFCSFAIAIEFGRSIPILRCEPAREYHPSEEKEATNRIFDELGMIRSLPFPSNPVAKTPSPMRTHRARSNLAS